MILAIAILSATQLHSLERLANGTCSAEVRTYISHTQEVGYTYPYRKRVIYIARNRPESRLTVFHECYHLLNPKATEEECERFAYRKAGLRF